MKSLSYLSSCLSLLLMGSVLLNPPEAQAEKTAKADGKAADAKTTGSKSTNGKSGKARKTIKTPRVSFSIEPPAGFTLSEAEGSGGNIFALSDPKGDEKEDAVITISVVASDGKTNQKQFVDGLMAGYREDMNKFTEDPGPEVTINGAQFQNRAFFGTDKTSGIKSIGDIYCTLRGKDYVVFVATASGKKSLDNLAKLTDSIRTVKF